MGRQSTRHRYKSRGDKNRAVWRLLRYVAIGALILFLFLAYKNWDDWWRYYRTYFY